MQKYLSLVKFSHTIFALPFALIGFFIAYVHSNAPFDWTLFLLVLACMVFARSAAMAFNRYLDRDIDGKNPRTAGREIPSGALTANRVLVFVILNAFLFILCAYFINPLCFYLSPVALLVILGYSYTKRFTWLCHFVLGLGLALAPIGAYLAITGTFNLLPLLYSLVVLTWVSGFDIIYALQDEGFDSEQSLYSVPTWLGGKKALRLSVSLHILTGMIILFAAYTLTQSHPDFWALTWGGTIVFIGLLAYQHSLVKWNDLSKINLAFFTTNGLASLILGVCTILDVWI